MGIVLALAGGADDRGRCLLGGRAAPGAIAPAHFAGDDGGTNGLFGAPVGSVDGGVAQEREQRFPFRGQMLREAPHVGQWAGVEQSSGESRGQGFQRFAEVIAGQLTGAGVVAQAKGLLQQGVDVGGDTAVGMVPAPLLSHRLSNEGGLNLPCLVE